jgi:hypothetical protein
MGEPSPDGLTSEGDCTLQQMPPRWSGESWESDAKGDLSTGVLGLVHVAFGFAMSAVMLSII